MTLQIEEFRMDSEGGCGDENCAIEGLMANIGDPVTLPARAK
jgi:hypothetical protein